MRHRVIRWVPVVAAFAFLAFPGCGSIPRIPTIDQVRQVPDSSQVTIVPPEQVEPREGPVGTVITVHGKGLLFPAGIVHVKFSGTGAVEFENPEPTQELRIRIPFGAVAGPFGFTIAGRTKLIDNVLPTSDVFHAFAVPFPGFRVIPVSPLPTNGPTSPPGRIGPPPTG